MPRSLECSIIYVLAMAAGLGLAGCDGGDPAAELEEADELADDGKYEAWNAVNNPAFVDRTFIYEIDALPVTGRAAQAPWPSTYWPAYEDSLNVRWDGPASRSPAEKYAAAFGRPSLPLAITNRLGVYGGDQPRCDDDSSCEGDATCVRPRGVDGPLTGACIPGWWGICNGWTAAAIAEPAPRRPVVRNGVTFYPGDLEGLMSLIYYYPVPTEYLGDRCDVTGPGVDGNGRPRAGSCRDMNAGTLFVVATNFLGLRGQAFAEDRVADAEVWNQPVLGFDITNAEGGRPREITEAQATRLVTGRSGAYRFNRRATRFFDIAMDLHYVTESAASRTSHVDEVDAYTLTDSYRFVLEVDDDGRVIGGEYVGASKTAHPDFVWWTTGKPYGFLPGGITYAAVKSMFDESAAPLGARESVLLLEEPVSGTSVYVPIGVRPGKTLTVTMRGTGNADLYLKMGRRPTLSSYDRASAHATSRERISVTAGDAGGTYYLRVRPQERSTVTVTATIR